MTRFEFLLNVEHYKYGEIGEKDMVAAADAFEKALLQQAPCSTSVPPSPKDQLTFNSSIQELLAKVHDAMEMRYELTAEDLLDVASVLVACQ